MMVWVVGAAVFVIIGAVVVFVMSRGGDSSMQLADGGADPTKSLVWTVMKLTRETPSTVSFEVDATMPFSAGQFVLIRPKPELPWRAYSFSRAPDEPLRLTVKQVAQGVVSTHVTTQLAVGDTLEVKGPYGQFVLPSSATNVLLLAGGSGVTPMIAMLREQAKKGWPAKVTLIDGNRTANEVILKAELDELEAGSGGKLTVQHVLDDATNGVKGPLTADRLAPLLEPLDSPDVVGLCGPTPMMESARAVLAARWPSVKVLEEKFTQEAQVSADAPVHTVTLQSGGKLKTFTAREGEPVLAAARKGKVSLQAGCEMGACGTCRVKVTSGQLETPTDSCLSDDERAQGYALVCVGTAKQDATIEPAP